MRLVAGPGGVVADPQGRRPGRGAYLCRDAACWQIAEKRRSLDRALRTRLSAEDWKALRVGTLG